MIFNLPQVEVSLPNKVASEVKFRWVNAGCTGDLKNNFINRYEKYFVVSGPGTVLILMKFNVQELVPSNEWRKHF